MSNNFLLFNVFILKHLPSMTLSIHPKKWFFLFGKTNHLPHVNFSFIFFINFFVIQIQVLPSCVCSGVLHFLLNVLIRLPSVLKSEKNFEGLWMKMSLNWGVIGDLPRVLVFGMPKVNFAFWNMKLRLLIRKTKNRNIYLSFGNIPYIHFNFFFFLVYKKWREKSHYPRPNRGLKKEFFKLIAFNVFLSVFRTERQYRLKWKGRVLQIVGSEATKNK